MFPLPTERRERTPHPLVGAVLGGTYAVQAVLARGGMGTVLEAEHLRLGSRVAVKVLARGHLEDEGRRRRFFEEAQTLARLSHPHVVQVLDYDVAGSWPYLVMERIDGETLRRRLARRILSAVEVAAVVEQVASALQAAHRAGVVHRDLKPSNVMLVSVTEAPFFVKLIDFGISATPYTTDREGIVGTPQYMSPEQATSGQVDARTDQFSLAVMVWEMLTGDVPFRAATTLETIQCVAHDPLPSLAEAWPSPVVDHVEAVLVRALAKRPEDRFPTIEAFVEELKRPLRAPDADPLVPPPLRRAPASSVRMRTTHPFSPVEHLLVHLGGLGATVHRARDLTVADRAMTSDMAYVAWLLGDDITVHELLIMSTLDEATTLECVDQLRRAGVVHITADDEADPPTW